jgi:hypothetical protein
MSRYPLNKQSLAKKQAQPPSKPASITGHHVFVCDEFAPLLDRLEGDNDRKHGQSPDQQFDDAIAHHVYAALSHIDNGDPYPSHRVFRAIFIGREAYRASCAASNSRLCRNKWPKLKCEVLSSDINDRTSPSPYGHPYSR